MQSTQFLLISSIVLAILTVALVSISIWLKAKGQSLYGSEKIIHHSVGTFILPLKLALGLIAATLCVFALQKKPSPDNFSPFPKQPLTSGVKVGDVVKETPLCVIESIDISSPFPFPALLFESYVKVEDVVEKGTPLCTVEAMKLEMVIRAPFSGKVTKIFFNNMDMIDGKPIIRLERLI